MANTTNTPDSEFPARVETTLYIARFNPLGDPVVVLGDGRQHSIRSSEVPSDILRAVEADRVRVFPVTVPEDSEFWWDNIEWLDLEDSEG